MVRKCTPSASCLSSPDDPGDSGQEEVHSKLPKVGKHSSGSKRKHQTSPAYLRKAQEMRMAQRLARYIREGRKVGWLITRRLKFKGGSSCLAC